MAGYLGKSIILFLASYIPLSISHIKLPLPAPPGQQNVHISNFALTDHSRLDPYAPQKSHRRIMVSLFHPGTRSKTSLTPYMPPATATFHDKSLAGYGIPVPDGTFEAFHLQSSTTPSNKSYPLVLFSPGLGESRLVYSLMLQWISSLGFTVVSIDHPYDAGIVEFPDGSVIYATDIPVPDGLPKDLAVRVADARFVLDALSSRSEVDPLPADVSSLAINTNRVAIFGHSFGGATAAEALLADSRFISGLNFDGLVLGRATEDDDKNAFVIFAREGNNQTTNSSWGAFWQRLKGWKLQLEINGTAHGSFTDFPALAEALGIDPAQDAKIAALVGTIKGRRMLTVLRAYVGAFLGYTLRGEEGKLLGRPTKRYAEVLFQNLSLPC